ALADDRVLRDLGQPVVPDQHAHLDALLGLALEQIAQRERTRIVALEAHGRVEAPTDEVDTVPGFLDALVDLGKGFFTADQRSDDVSGWARRAQRLVQVGKPIHGYRCASTRQR